MSIRFILLLMFTLCLSAQELTTAPDFTLKNFDLKKITLSEKLKKTPVLVSFWASWCEPCKKEMLVLSDLAIKYQDKFKIILIAADKGNAMAAARKYIKDKKYKFEAVFDNEGEIYPQYSDKNTLPVSFIVGTDGKILWQKTGAGTKSEFEEQIKKVLD